MFSGRGVFTGNGGAINTVALNHCADAGSSFTALLAPAINNAGDVVFRASLFGSAADSIVRVSDSLFTTIADNSADLSIGLDPSHITYPIPE